MHTYFSSFFLFLSLIISAQTAESVYLQQEHDRLLRVSYHEIAIQNYISQNIGTYVLPTTVTDRINLQKHEDGSNFTTEEVNDMYVNEKKRELRKQFLMQNPSVINDFTATPLTAATSCVNNGFEDGTTASFNYFSQRFNTNWQIYQNFPTETVNTPNSETGIISLISGNTTKDQYSKLFRVKSGEHSLRLNNGNDGGGDVSLLKRTIEVGATQNNITFNYALVLQDPNHVDTVNGVVINSNPYYQCRLITPSGQIININKIVANKSNTAVFKTADQNDVVYTDWICENIDVSQFRGQTVTVEVIIADCGWGGHFGYAYFDNFCGVNCAGPTFGQVTLNPLGISCPLLPVTVSGSFITPAGYVLDNLQLKAIDYNTLQEVYVSQPSQYTLFGNEFNFKVTGPDLFPNGPASRKFDFYVSASFKLIGTNSAPMTVQSQSANEGADVTFINGTCQICNSCETIQSCQAPTINDINILSNGQIVMDYTVSTANLSTPQYQIATDPNFTNVVHQRIGFAYNQVEYINMNGGNIPNNAVLYIRARKHCGSNYGISTWSNTFQFTSGNYIIKTAPYAITGSAIPNNLGSPHSPNAGGGICTTGSAWTRSFNVSTQTPGVGTQLYLTDGNTKAVPGNLASYGSDYNTYGIRWVRFYNGNNKIFDVNPSTGVITGVSSQFNCN